MTAMKTKSRLLLLVVFGLAQSSFAAPTSQPAAATTAQVSIDNFSFSPAELTVVAGTSVTWTNRDDVIHTATSSQKPALFNSGTLDTDQKYTYRFEKAGTYEYFCKVHPHMTGKVIVTPAK